MHGDFLRADGSLEVCSLPVGAAFSDFLGDPSLDADVRYSTNPKTRRTFLFSQMDEDPTP